MQLKQFFNDFRWMPRIVKKLFYLNWAIADPNWFWYLNLMLENANVPHKYRYMFIPNQDQAIFIDCWMNVGLITDIARKMDMEVYWFEPNPTAIRLLNKKYIWDKNVHIYPYAVADKEWEIDFFLDPKWLFDQWATIYKEFAETEWNWRVNNSIKVPIKKLTDIIKKDILPKHKHIHLLKMDIEGAEFWVLNDIIDEWLYNNITYIVVETHERFFKNWKDMINNLKKKINDYNIKNIYLDWI